MSGNDIEELKAFVDDNPDLEQLEATLDRFNLFASLDIVRQELRHSAFIRWLLDPSETHGLGDYWLRQLLLKVIKDGEVHHDDFPSLFDLDGWNLGRAEVRSEWRNIDLLIVDEDNLFVCAIENKVDAGEHANQLQRYREFVEGTFGQYKKAFVFLTVSGEPPSDENYVRLSHRDLVCIVEHALERRKSQLNDDVRLFVQQYIDMVRRYILEESEIQELCRRLYKNHRKALDLIFENRPDRAAEVRQITEGYIASRDDLIADDSSKTCIRFLPHCMDSLPHEGSGWTSSKRIVLCELENRENFGLRLKVILGPGNQELRQKVYIKARSVPRVFGRPKPKLSSKWHTFFSIPWLSKKDYDELDEEEIRQKIDEKMEEFLQNKGKEVANALREVDV